MTHEERETLNNNQKDVMHLRYRLVKYQLDGIDPPERFLNELIIAKRLVRLDSRVHE